jgi:hypothetical protein
MTPGAGTIADALNRTENHARLEGKSFAKHRQSGEAGCRT